MSIIVLILKIIGIILLIILGLLILAVLTVFFMPLQYRLTGDAKEDISVKLRISWLFRAVSYHGLYEDKKFKQKLLVLGIPLHIGEEKSPKKKKSKNRLKKKGKSDIPEITEQSTLLPSQGEQEKGQESIKPAEETVKTDDARTESAVNRKRKSLLGMIISKWETIKKTVENIKREFQRLWQKAGSLKEAFIQIKEKIRQEENKDAIMLLFREVKYLLRHVLPDKVKANLKYGTTDPATTGQILGGISAIPIIYRYQVQILPDFTAEEFYVSGEFDIKGHARGIHALMAGVRLLKDKNIRSIIQQYRN